MYFRNFIIISPCSREQTWNPFTQGCFVPRFVEIDHVVLEKKIKIWKVYDNANEKDDNETADNGQILII